MITNLSRRYLHAPLAAFFVVLFALAPLICIRFCALRHWSALPKPAQAGLHLHHDSGAAQPQPATGADDHHAPLNELQTMLLAMVEFLPAVLVLAAVRQLHSRLKMPWLDMALRAIEPAVQPPRLAH